MVDRYLHFVVDYLVEHDDFARRCCSGSHCSLFKHIGNTSRVPRIVIPSSKMCCLALDLLNLLDQLDLVRVPTELQIIFESIAYLPPDF